MSEIRLTGQGAPTRMTKGVVGQHYEDLNTGNIYECLVASEQSRLNWGIGGGYVWKLKYTGDDRRDHEAIFGAGNSVEMVEKVLIEADNIEFEELGENSGFRMIDIPSEYAKIDVGQPVTVVYDGVTYALKVKETTAQYLDEDPYTIRYMGNAGMANSIPESPTINGAEDTGEPFYVEFYGDDMLMGCVVIIKTDEPVHSIKATVMVEAPTPCSTMFVNVSYDEVGRFYYADKSYTDICNAVKDCIVPCCIKSEYHSGSDTTRYTYYTFSNLNADRALFYMMSGTSSSVDMSIIEIMPSGQVVIWSHMISRVIPS